MRKSSFFFLLLSFGPLGFAQLDSNSITVSASQNASLQPDQAVFSVSVQSGINTGFEDVLAALQGSGITAANFSGVSSQGQTISVLSTTPIVVWDFSLSVPLANTKATVASLTTLQQNVSQMNNGLQVSFSIVGTQVSQQLAQSQTCSLPGLVTAATTQAQSLAAAGGVTLGSILALASSTSNVVSTSTPTLVSSLGFVSSVSSSTIPPPCSITVKFNVTRN